MAKKAHKEQASALDEVRRHVRIFVDLGRVASESTDEDGFLDQVVVQVARAVEIDHVKVLRYRRREADLTHRRRLRVERGRCTVGYLVCRFAVAAGPLIPDRPAGRHQELPSAG
jgi:hypothetical protein